MTFYATDDFKTSLPADEAEELDRLLKIDWPEGLSLALNGRKLAGCLLPGGVTHATIIIDLRQSGWRQVMGWYRMKPETVEEVLRQAIAESMKMRANQAALRLTLDTQRGINEAIGILPHAEAAE